MVFAFLAGLAYDLEPLAAGAGHKKSGGGSNRGDKHMMNLPERHAFSFWQV
jgi:hypothetical protein